MRLFSVKYSRLLLALGALLAPLSTTAMPNPTATVTAPPLAATTLNLLSSKATEADVIAKQLQLQGKVRLIVQLKQQTLAKAEQQYSVESRQFAQALKKTQQQALAQLSSAAQNSAVSFRYVTALAVSVTESDLAALLNQPEVAHVALDAALKPQLTDSVELIQATELIDAGHDGAGWTVAVLDTGIASAHEAFTDKIVGEACFSTTDEGEKSLSLCPDDSDEQIGLGSAEMCQSLEGCEHGTHVAGIAVGQAATASGVAPGAKVMPIQVFSEFYDPNECGYENCILAMVSDQMRALEYVYSQRHDYAIAAVNLSLGGGHYSNHCDYAVPAYTDLVERLAAVNIATIVASGNEIEPRNVAFPSCIEQAVSVGSTLPRDGIFNYGYSTKRDAVSYFSNGGPALDLYAPGHNILGPVAIGFEQKSGTSMAAPHVAGCMALLRSTGLNLSVDELTASLKQSGRAIYDRRSGLVNSRIRCAAVLDYQHNPYQLPTPANFREIDVGTTHFSVSWSPVALANQYHVQVASDGNFEHLVQEQIVAATETTITVTELLPGSDYYVRVQARSDSHRSRYSDGPPMLVRTLPEVSLANAVDAPSLVLANVPNHIKPWQADKTYSVKGDYAAKTGTISHSESSVMTASIAGPATLSFSYRVSSEEGWDEFTVDINGLTVLIDSGETGWRNFSVELTEQINNVYWRYTKDEIESAGLDAAWVDNVKVVRAADTYQVDLIANGGMLQIDGLIGCASRCSAPVTAGEPVTIYGPGYNEYRNVQWGGACAGQTGTSCTLVPEGDLVVSAEWDFIELYVPIRASSLGNGSVSVLTDTIIRGTTGFVRYEPDPGYRLAQVDGSCEGIAAAGIFETETVIGGCELLFSFEPIQYLVEVQAQGPGSFSPQSQWVNIGEQAQFSILPDYQYHVTEVDGCGAQVEGEMLVTSAMYENCLISANFGLNYLSVEFVPGHYGIRTGGGALQQTVLYDEPATLPELAVHPAFDFKGWGDTVTAVTTDMTLHADYQQISGDLEALQAVDLTLLDHGDALLEQRFEVPWGESFEIDLENFVAAGNPRVSGSCPKGVWHDSIYQTGQIITSCTLIISDQAAPSSGALLLIMAIEANK